MRFLLLMKPMKQRKVRIRENSLLARIAAWRMRCSRVAIVFGHTIHLHNTSAKTFVHNSTWLLHELKHVEQYERLGILAFFWRYVIESIRKGYYNNAFEVEARAAEYETELYLKYDLSEYTGLPGD